MILTCPNCGTQYVVKDGAIPPQGRQVRCAACKHSWHQDPEAKAEDEPEPQAEAQPQVRPQASAETEDETFAEATLIEPRSGPEAEERAYEEAMIESEPAAAAPGMEPAREPESVSAPAMSEPVAEARPAPAQTDWDAPPELEAQDDEFSPFPASDEVEPRRRSPLLKILLVVLLVAAAAAAFWFLAPPEWKARVGLGTAGASPLALVTTHMDRQRLASGNETLNINGRVINPTREEQQVPPLYAQLKSSTGQVVYSWTIAPPARTLPPGGSASFYSTEVDVPPGGEELTITLGRPKA